MRFTFSGLSYLGLFSTQHLIVLAQASSASWQFPNADGLIVNNIDTVVLQWESNFDDPWMQIWCQNGTAANNEAMGSDFKVPSSGKLGYVLESYDPSQTSFPVACHGRIATAQNGGGVNSPFGVTFVFVADAGAKTFSLGSTNSASSASRTSSSSTTPSSRSTDRATSPTMTLPLNTSPPLYTEAGSVSVPSSGISSGAKAGIGVGVAILVLGVIGAMAWACLYRRTKSAAGKSNLGPRMSELEAQARKYEMAAPHDQQELEAGPHRPRVLQEMP